MGPVGFFETLRFLWSLALTVWLALLRLAFQGRGGPQKVYHATVSFVGASGPSFIFGVSSVVLGLRAFHPVGLLCFGLPPRGGVSHKASPEPRQNFARASPELRQSLARASPEPRQSLARASPEPRQSFARASRTTPAPPTTPPHELHKATPELPRASPDIPQSFPKSLGLGPWEPWALAASGAYGLMRPWG